MKLHDILTVIDSGMGRNKQLARFLVQDLAGCDWATPHIQTQLRDQFSTYGMKSDVYSLVAATEKNITLTLFSQTCRLLKTLLDDVLKTNELLISHVNHCGIMMTYRRANGQSIPAFQASKVYSDFLHLCPVTPHSYLPGTALCEVLVQHYDLHKDKSVTDAICCLEDKKRVRKSFKHRLRHAPSIMSRDGLTPWYNNCQSSQSTSRQAAIGDIFHHTHRPVHQLFSEIHPPKLHVVGPKYTDHQAPVERYPIPWDGRTHRPATALSNREIFDVKPYREDRRQQPGSGIPYGSPKASRAPTTVYDRTQSKVFSSDGKPNIEPSNGHMHKQLLNKPMPEASSQTVSRSLQNQELSKAMPGSSSQNASRSLQKPELNKPMPGSSSQNASRSRQKPELSKPMSGPSSQMIPQSLNKPAPPDQQQKTLIDAQSQLKPTKQSVPVVRSAGPGCSDLKRRYESDILVSDEEMKAKRQKIREELELKKQRLKEALSKDTKKKPTVNTKITTVPDLETSKAMKRKADDKTKVEFQPKKKIVLKSNKLDGSWRAAD